MPLSGEYAPSPVDWAREQAEKYMESGGTDGTDLQGKPVILLTTVGAKTGKLRKTPLMRVEHDGQYAVVASMGGAPKHPVWYLNLLADPHVTLQDGDRVMDLQARTASAAERAEWWPHATEAWPPYDEYQAKTEREIPIVLFDPV